MRAAPRFAICSSCGHGAVSPPDRACGICGGRSKEASPPPDLFDAWRCACAACRLRVC